MDPLEAYVKRMVNHIIDEHLQYHVSAPVKECPICKHGIETGYYKEQS